MNDYEIKEVGQGRYMTLDMFKAQLGGGAYLLRLRNNISFFCSNAISSIIPFISNTVSTCTNRLMEPSKKQSDKQD